MPAVNSRNVEEIVIPPEKKNKKTMKYWMNEDKYYIMELYKISKLLNDSSVSKFVTKNGLKWFIRQSIFCKQEYKV